MLGKQLYSSRNTRIDFNPSSGTRTNTAIRLNHRSTSVQYGNKTHDRFADVVGKFVRQTLLAAVTVVIAGDLVYAP